MTILFELKLTEIYKSDLVRFGYMCLQFCSNMKLSLNLEIAIYDTNSRLLIRVMNINMKHNAHNIKEKDYE